MDASRCVFRVREAGRRGPRYGARQFVDVSVMGASGETQTAKTSFPLNEESLRLTLEVGTYWTKDSLPALKAVVQTNAGAEFKGRVEVTGEIYRMQDGKQVEKVLSGFAFLPISRYACRNCPHFRPAVTRCNCVL